MKSYGDVDEPYAIGGLVHLFINQAIDQWASTDLSPDEARLLGLRLIKMADEAESQE